MLVGSNRRYPHHAGQLAEERELRRAAAAGPLRTLTAEQLALGSRPVTIVPDTARVWALAWLRFGDVDVRCTVRVLRWTSDAVGVAVDVDGNEQRCWVWQGAATRIANRQDAW